MIWGLSTATFTLVHVVISLVGIASGFIIVAGMVRNREMRSLAGVFLVTTILTSVTGFAFPNEHITPGIVIGVLSLLVLAPAVLGFYAFKLAGAWRKTYAITALIALYFNFFVLIVQSFLKVPALHALAPHGNEAPFAITQGTALVMFIGFGVLAVRRFKGSHAPSIARAAAKA
jgi:hypothetical protein